MRFLAVAVAVAACGLPAAAQNFGQLPPLTEQVEVHVVNVDVAVTDRDGRPIVDLTKDDFEIFEDGHPQKVTNFSVMRNAAVPQAMQAKTRSQTAASDTTRRVLLVIDNNFLSVIDRNRAIDSVEKYLDTSFNGEWAVAAVSRNAEMLQPFTSDKALIRAALAKARTLPSVTAQQTIDRSILSQKFVRKGDTTVSDDYREKVGFSAREQTFRNLLTIQNTARAVVDTARGYAAEGGKKFIVLLTGGVELNTTYLAYEKDDDLELRELKHQIDVICDAMVREANAANFTLHVINARTRGMIAPQHDVANHSSGITAGALLRDFGGDPIDVSDVDTIPLSIALGTGGLYLPSADVHESLSRIDTVTSNFYSLGYSPEHNGDRQYHAIRVRVKRAGVRVANRSGYFDDTLEDRLQEVLRVRMSFDPGFGSLPVQVKIGAASSSDRELVVPVTAAMPLARITVVPQEQNFVGRVHVYLSIFDESGRNIGFQDKTQEITFAPDQMQRLGEFRYTMKVRLQKGSFTVVMTLRDELSNEIGSASESVRL